MIKFIQFATHLLAVRVDIRLWEIGLITLVLFCAGLLVLFGRFRPSQITKLDLAEPEPELNKSDDIGLAVQHEVELQQLVQPILKWEILREENGIFTPTGSNFSSSEADLHARIEQLQAADGRAHAVRRLEE